MTQTLVSVAIFLVILGLIPIAIKWMQRRVQGGVVTTAAATKIISAAAVGPHQRVVTVEIGPEGRRTWLVLGVTAQSITCLHTMGADMQVEKGPVSVSRQGTGQA